MDRVELAPRLRGLPTVEVLAVKLVVPVAERFSARLLGLALLPRERAGRGLLIPRCRSIHTFGMHFAIDVVFLDEERQIVGRIDDVRPGRMLTDRRAATILEVCPSHQPTEPRHGEAAPGRPG